MGRRAGEYKELTPYAPGRFIAVVNNRSVIRTVFSPTTYTTLPNFGVYFFKSRIRQILLVFDFFGGHVFVK